ncbi:headcase protein family like domain-containing protein [Ditylenchus destructor]|nr:headcase protein family like domain-containing protein [Ditylenchus destructor]
MGRGRHRHHGCANAFLGEAKKYVQSSEIIDHLGCGVPHVKCCLPYSPPPNQDGIKMVCENKNCPYDIELIHRECFSKLEEQLVEKMTKTGCGRGWSRKKCHTNLWNKKGIHLAADCLKCNCGKGRIVYDADIKPDILPPSFNAKAEERTPQRDIAIKQQSKGTAVGIIISRITKGHKNYFRKINIDEQSGYSNDISSDYGSQDDYEDVRANEPLEKRTYRYLFSVGSNGYVCAEQGDVGPLTATGKMINEHATFLLHRNEDGTVSLKSKANDKFVSIDDFQGGKLIPDSDTVGLHNKFTLELQKKDWDPVVAIKSVANGKYVTSQCLGKALLANKSTVNKFEMFKMGVIE